MNSSYCAKGNLSICKSVAFETPKGTLLLCRCFWCCCFVVVVVVVIVVVVLCSVSTWLLWCSRSPASRNTLALELEIYPCLMHRFTALLEITSTFNPLVACACGYHSEWYHCVFFFLFVSFFLWRKALHSPRERWPSFYWNEGNFNPGG